MLFGLKCFLTFFIDLHRNFLPCRRFQKSGSRQTKRKFCRDHAECAPRCEGVHERRRSAPRSASSGQTEANRVNAGCSGGQWTANASTEVFAQRYAPLDSLLSSRMWRRTVVPVELLFILVWYLLTYLLFCVFFYWNELWFHSLVIP